MRIEFSKLDPKSPSVTHGPTLRIAPTGGCNLPGCTCSGDKPWLAIGDGETWVHVELSNDEIEALHRALESRQIVILGAP